MKAKRILLMLLVFSLFLIAGPGCRVQSPTYHKKGMIYAGKRSGKVPPGKMKKAMGAKSASAFAPGHNKNSKAIASGKGKKPKVPSYKKNKHYKKRK